MVPAKAAVQTMELLRLSYFLDPLYSHDFPDVWNRLVFFNEICYRFFEALFKPANQTAYTSLPLDVLPVIAVARIIFTAKVIYSVF